MPSYIVTCEEGRLTGSQKSQIAEAVTRAHGDSTGAAYYFARFTFNEVKPGNYFLGGTQLDCDQIFVHGTIREGRPTDMKNALMARLTADVAIASQMKPNCVWVYLSEFRGAAARSRLLCRSAWAQARDADRPRGLCGSVWSLRLGAIRPDAGPWAGAAGHWC